MKNINKPLSMIAMSLMLVAGLTSCGQGTKELTANEKIVQEAMTMSYEDLVAKAKEEVGTNTVKTYGNSSQLVKALEKFTADTGIKIENNKKSDIETYTELGEAFKSDKYVADMVLLQDGNKLQNEMMNYDYLINYIPKENKANIAEDDLNPTAAVYLNKVFMYNNTDYNGSNKDTAKAGVLKDYFTNVWQVAGSKADGERHIDGLSFKTPSNENVNMNFLVMLTSDAWCTKLADAYKAYYGKDYEPVKEFPTIGHKWIAEFLTNSHAHDSDGTACKDLSKGNGGSMALVNLNKQKSLTETGVGTLDKANVSYPAMELDAEGKAVQGFGGFCYKMYAQVTANAKYPYAACAIINYITQAEGFTNAWGTKVGYYSTNKTVAIAEGDKALAWWKQNLVIEDPEYVASSYRDVFQFVQQYEGK